MGISQYDSKAFSPMQPAPLRRQVAEEAQNEQGPRNLLVCAKRSGRSEGETPRRVRGNMRTVEPNARMPRRQCMTTLAGKGYGGPLCRGLFPCAPPKAVAAQQTADDASMDGAKTKKAPFLRAIPFAIAGETYPVSPSRPGTSYREGAIGGMGHFRSCAAQTLVMDEPKGGTPWDVFDKGWSGIQKARQCVAWHPSPAFPAEPIPSRRRVPECVAPRMPQSGKRHVCPRAPFAAICGRGAVLVT